MDFRLSIVVRILPFVGAGLAFLLWRSRPRAFSDYPYKTRIRLEWPFGSSWIRMVDAEHVAGFRTARRHLAVGYILMVVLVIGSWLGLWAQHKKVLESKRRLEEMQLTSEYILNRVRDSLLAKRQGDEERGIANMTEARECCRRAGWKTCSDTDLLRIEHDDTLERLATYREKSLHDAGGAK